MAKALIAILILAMATIVTSAAISISSEEDDDVRRDPDEFAVAQRTTIAHFLLGTSYEGSVPIYQYQNTQTGDSEGQEMRIQIDYPPADSKPNDQYVPLITQVNVYLEGDDGFESQVYVTEGGIGERSIGMEITASNTDSLRYIIVINGYKM